MTHTNRLGPTSFIHSLVRGVDFIVPSLLLKAKAKGKAVSVLSVPPRHGTNHGSSLIAFMHSSTIRRS